jgi:hypothetical protein
MAFFGVKWALSDQEAFDQYSISLLVHPVNEYRLLGNVPAYTRCLTEVYYHIILYSLTGRTISKKCFPNKIEKHLALADRYQP